MATLHNADPAKSGVRENNGDGDEDRRTRTIRMNESNESNALYVAEFESEAFGEIGLAYAK